NVTFAPPASAATVVVAAGFLLAHGPPVAGQTGVGRGEGARVVRLLRAAARGLGFPAPGARGRPGVCLGFVGPLPAGRRWGRLLARQAAVAGGAGGPGGGPAGRSPVAAGPLPVGLAARPGGPPAGGAGGPPRRRPGGRGGPTQPVPEVERRRDGAGA